MPDGSVTVRGKAPNKAGSVYVQASTGRWVATWYDDHGKRREVSRKDRRSAIAARDAAIAQAAAGAPRHARFTGATTVADFTAWWLDSIGRHSVRTSSLARYTDRARRITTTLGELRLEQLTAEGLQRWQAELLDSGLAAGTVSDTRTFLGQVLRKARELNLIGTNPLERVTPIRVTRRPATALTPEQVRALVTAAANDPHGAAIALLFVQGWRISEVLGLAWDDVDLDAGTAEVRRAAVYVDGVGVALGPPKTAGVIGTHHLAPGVVELLRARRRAQAAERLAAGPVWRAHEYEGRPVDLVFTASDGRLMLRQTITKRLKALAASSGIDPALVSTHTGRRSVVTALRRAGVPLEDVAVHVGHADARTTAGYVKGLGNRPAEVARVAANLLDRPTEGSATTA